MKQRKADAASVKRGVVVDRIISGGTFFAVLHETGQILESFEVTTDGRGRTIKVEVSR